MPKEFIVWSNLVWALMKMMNSFGMILRFFESESRGKKRSLIQENNQIFDGFIIFVSINLFLQCLHYRMIWVNLKALLCSHVAHGASVSKSLCFHNTFHVSRPSIL